MHTGCFHLLTTVNNTAMNMDIQISVESHFQFLNMYPGVKLLPHRSCIFNMLRNHMFPTAAESFYIATSHAQEFQFVHIFQSDYFPFLQHPSSRCKVVSHCGLDLHFSND